MEFLIRWEGFDSTHDSWEPEACIHDPKSVQDYWDYVASREQQADSVSLHVVLLHTAAQLEP